MKSMQFEIIDHKGSKKLCDVMATYHDDNTNKDFVIYTDRTLNKEKKLNIYYSLYRQFNNSIKLIDITTLEDRKIGLELIKEVVNDINNI